MGAGLGFRVLWFRGLGFRGLGFRGLGFLGGLGCRGFWVIIGSIGCCLRDKP